MGFYGNITNVANTTFQFDKIYSNRLDMEAHCNSDGIMVGRYVLVEYDNDAAYPVIEKDTDGKFYPVGVTGEARIAIKYSAGEIPMDHKPTDTFYKGEIAQEQGKDTIIFYQCAGGDSDNNAIFTEITKVNSTNTYIANFAIDEKQYAKSGDKFTGFDSTVWVKTSDNTGTSVTTKYVNIASLNSVVPTFDVVADAPTMTPITPHFDSDSTNVYYKLHMQSPYGFRVAKGEDGKSDEGTIWYETTYDKSNDKTVTTSKIIDKADIYYNKDGFSETTVSKVANDNYIKLEPSAKSGAIYSHGKEENDIQEFRFHLPAIGNMMSDAWDIIHGPLRDDEQGDENSSLQGRLDSFKGINNNQIPVKRTDGTLVGTHINGAKDYEMTTIEEAPLITKTDDEKYFKSDDAWIQTTIDSSSLKKGDKEAQKDNNGIAIHHTWTKGTDTTSEIDINGEGDTFEIVTPIADNAGHIVAHNTETVTLPYGYKTITTNGLAKTKEGNEITDKDLDSSTGGTSSADNTQDTLAINTVNKWIQTEVTNDKIEFAHEIHKIKNSDYETETDLNSSNLGGLTTEKTEVKLLEEERNFKIYGIKGLDRNTLVIPDWSYDEAGHITEKHNREFVLPFGFKNITIPDNSISIDVPASTKGTQTADNTQDTLNIQSSNKWIKIDGATEDTIKFGHDIQGENFGNIYYAATITKEDGEVTHNQNPQFGDTVNILNVTVDNAGHTTSFGTNTIKIPQGSYESAQNVSEATEVITSISFDETKGKISSTKANTKTLKLTDYPKVASATNESISSDETINGAFGKLEYRLNNEIDKRKEEDTALSNAITKEIEDRDKAIATAVSNLIDGAPETYDTFKEISEYINTHGTEAANMSTAIQNNTKAINNEATRADTEEKRIAALVGETKVSTQIDNKINALALGTASKKDVGYFATAEQGTKADNAIDKTTYENKIADLEAKIADLTNRLNTLEKASSDTTE